MGLGSAFAFISVLVLARDLFSKRRFALLTGITQMLAAVGAMGGSYPLEALVSHFGWRQSMLLLAIIGYVLAVLILIFVRYCDCKISDGNSLKELLSGAGKLIKTRSTWAIALYACSLWAPMSAFASLWGVRFLQHVYHISHSLAALSITFMWIGLAAGSPIVGALSELFATRKKILISCALLGLVSFSLVFFHVSKSYWLMCVFIFFAGFACAGQALSFAVVRDRKIAKDKLGAAIGINNMAVVISGAIFQPLVGWLIGLYHQQGLIVIAGVYLLGLLVAVVLVKETLVLNRELR
jgi:MFS family permease